MKYYLLLIAILVRISVMTSTYQVKYSKIFCKSFIILVVLWVTPYLFGKYVDISFPYISKNDIPSELVGFQDSAKKRGKEFCPVVSPLLKGTDLQIYNYLSNNALSRNLADSLDILTGGVWQPLHCQSKFEVVIIVPYRARSRQLEVFLNYMHPFLQRQQLHYRIIVVEQMGNEQFNRAKLLNIGYKEAIDLGPPNYCLIFHDVDLLPENDYNTYACTHQPRHMYSSLDIFRYQLPYRELAGGAFAILAPHFQEVNGFSNSFYGWGGEDDDFSNRLRVKGLQVQRFDPRVASYVMIPHGREVPSPKRWKQLTNNNNRTDDGLSTLKYEVLQRKYFPLYTHFYVK